MALLYGPTGWRFHKRGTPVMPCPTLSKTGTGPGTDYSNSRALQLWLATFETRKRVGWRLQMLLEPKAEF